MEKYKIQAVFKGRKFESKTVAGSMMEAFSNFLEKFKLDSEDLRDIVIETI